MSYERVTKLSGNPTWGFKEKLTSDQMNSVEDYLDTTLDGYAGGPVTPNAPIFVKGDGGGDGYAMGFEYAPAISKETEIVEWCDMFAGQQRNISGGNLIDPPHWVYGNQSATDPLDTHWTYLTVATVNWIRFPIPAKPNAVVKSVTVYLAGSESGAGDDHANFPTTLMSAHVYRVGRSGRANGSGSTVANKIFTSGDFANVGEYDDEFSAEITMPADISADPNTSDYLLYVEVRGESGTNSQAGNRIFGIKVTYTVSAGAGFRL